MTFSQQLNLALLEPEIARFEVWSITSKLQNYETSKGANTGSRRAIEEPKKGKSSKSNGKMMVKSNQVQLPFMAKMRLLKGT